MRLPEQRLWDTMKRNAPEEAWLQRVENVVIDGMPDVYVAIARRTSWVELKAPKMPKRSTTPLMGDKQGLNINQIGWHLVAAQNGVRSFVLVRDVERLCLLLLQGRLAKHINQLTLDEAKKLSVASDWQGIFQKLAL